MNVLILALKQIEEKLMDMVLIPRDDGAKANERLTRLIYRQLRFLTEHPGLPKLLFTDRLHTEDPELLRVVKRIMKSYTRYIESIIRQGVEEEIFDPHVEAHECATLIVELIQGLMFRCFLYNSIETLNDHTEPLAGYVLEAVGYRGALSEA